MSLQSNRMKPAEYQRTVYVVNAEEGIGEEDLLKEEYWAHVAAQLKPFDMLEVRTDDGAYWGELLVLDAGNNWAKVKMLRFIKLEVKVDETQLGPFAVKWKGPQHKFCVIRRSDGAILAKEISSKKEAFNWALDHQKAA